jgi:tetratricopeptide (TPR) repeat protein
VKGLTILFLLLATSCVTGVSQQELAQEYFNLGNAYFELGDFDRSYRYYRNALELTDQFPAAGYNLVRLLIERGDMDRAREYLLQLRRDDPENLLLIETEAFMYASEGKTSEAVALYRRVLDQSPGRVRAGYNLGLLKAREESWELARSVLEQHRMFADDDLDYRWLYAEALYRSGDESAALTELERYFLRVQDDAPRRLRLLQRYVKWEFFLPALEIAEDPPESLLRDGEFHFAIATAHLRGGSDFALGRRSLEEALRREFNDPRRLAELLQHVADDEIRVLQQLYQEWEIEIPENVRDSASL